MGRRLLVVDDDESLLNLARRHLEKAGFEVLTLAESTRTIDEIRDFSPDVVLLDLMMPTIDGLHLLQSLREDDELRGTKTIVITAKSFDFDRNQAYDLGALAFMTKPLDYPRLIDTINRVILDEMRITFWGTRGTLATPGPNTIKYGGNTSCVGMELTRDRLFVFDAGTGLAELGRKLMSAPGRKKVNLFITHPHWDHINGFPFFMPLYKQGNEVVIHGTSHGSISLRQVISGQMESIYFPVTVTEFAARVSFREILEGDYEIDGISLKTSLLNHPGIALGYRLTNSSGKSVAYITDNELVPGDAAENDDHVKRKLAKFLEGVDLLIHDSSYFDDEYRRRIGWGHPPLSELLKLAADAKVKRLALFHHDPEHNDERIAEKEAVAKRYLEERKLDIECFAAIEGSSICL